MISKGGAVIGKAGVRCIAAPAHKRPSSHRRLEKIDAPLTVDEYRVLPQNQGV
jgi:hypothetical protein